MASTYKPWEVDSEYGTHYVFDRAGDGIPMHSHVNKPMWHFTRCIKGSVRVYGDELDTTLTEGQSAFFKPWRMHEILALEDGSEVVNVFNNGKPADYEGMTPESLSGSVVAALSGVDYFPNS